MAQTTHLSQEDMKALEQSRRQFQQLTSNIASLKLDILQSNPLPQWSSLQTSASILAKNVETLTAHLAKHNELLNRTVIHPSTNYPGRVQEGVLESILRKKLEPGAEDWVEEGRELASIPNDSTITDKQQDEFMEWANQWIGERIKHYAMEEAGDEYTAEERESGLENVNTGLKRDYEDDVSSEEDDEMGGDESARPVAKTAVGEVKKDPSGTSRRKEDIWKFATTGIIAGQTAR